MPKRKEARREFRLSARDDDLLVEAAGLAGVSVSEFIVEHAVADAEALVAQHHIIELDADAHRRFMEALEGPPKSIPALVEAVQRSRHIKTVD
jgi:uncharacterized protein (DUF1778 family)